MPEEKELPKAKPIASGLAFSALAQIRNTEAQLRWMGFQFALGLNFVGWGATGVWILQYPDKITVTVLLVACIGAVYSNWVHYVVLGRDGRFLDFWSNKLAELEKFNGIEGEVKIFSSQRYLRLKTNGPTIQRILRRNVVVCMLVWVLFSLTALPQLFS